MKKTFNYLQLDARSFHAVTQLFVIVMIIGLTACVEDKPAGSSSLSIETTQIEVFKNPSCQCCNQWINHMEANGFSATINNSQNLTAVKSKYNIAPRYQSCHTALVEGYVFEGHIPADIIRQFLTEKPINAIGLAVPGMPIGSPGMEMGSRHDDYDVLLLKKDGSSEVYKHISALTAQN